MNIRCNPLFCFWSTNTPLIMGGGGPNSSSCGGYNPAGHPTLDSYHARLVENSFNLLTDIQTYGQTNVQTDGQTDPIYRKASILKIHSTGFVYLIKVKQF